VYDAGAPIYSSPALGPDGTVYVGAWNTLHAVTNSGATTSNRWIFASSLSAKLGAPSIATDGTIYVAGGNLYAISPGGSQRWSYPSVASACPAIGRDNSIYIQGLSFLYAVAPGGTLNWSGSGGGGGGPFSSAASGRDGTVYVESSPARTLYALKLDGTDQWNAPLGSPGVMLMDAPGIGADGTVYVCADDGLYAFAPSGSRLWFNAGALSPGSSVAIGRDGTIYVETTRGFFVPQTYGLGLYALTPEGGVRWQVLTNLLAGPSVRFGTPAIDRSGTIWCAACNWLFAFSPDGVVEWAFSAGPSQDPTIYSYSSPTIGPDGRIYATFGTKLYAFAGTNALADSAWPMYQQNPRHTGKVEKPSLQKPQKRSDANFQFELYAQTDQPYTIEASTNLNTWTSLTSFVATTLPTEVFDLDATNFPARFYRAVSDAPPGGKQLTR